MDLYKKNYLYKSSPALLFQRRELPFFFSGFSATSLLMRELDKQFYPDKWQGSFDEVLPYLVESFARAIDAFGRAFPHPDFKKDVLVIFAQLCNPDPQRRGIPRAIRGLTSQFALDRYISWFDLLARRADLAVRNN